MRIILIFLLLGLVSCSSTKTTEEPAPYHDAATLFVVKEIQQLDGMKNLTTYYIEIVDVNELSHQPNSTAENLKFWICDSVGKYKLGQPIHFDKNR